jgi:predicted Rossmann-fold nucleotide-binding protein
MSNNPSPKHKVGVYGSAADGAAFAKKTAGELGSVLASRDCIVITGATDGLPLIAARAAKMAGAEIWGFSPSRDLKHHKLETPVDDPSIYTKLIYTPRWFSFIDNLDACRKYRNVASTATADAGIIIEGRWGTLNEFTSLYDMGKIIGVLIGTGGIADALPLLAKKINKPTRAKVFFEKNPKRLITKIFAAMNARAKTN